VKDKKEEKTLEIRIKKLDHWSKRTNTYIIGVPKERK
jgi:hypothetical protein